MSEFLKNQSWLSGMSLIGTGIYVNIHLSKNAIIYKNTQGIKILGIGTYKFLLAHHHFQLHHGNQNCFCGSEPKLHCQIMRVFCILEKKKGSHNGSGIKSSIMAGSMPSLREIRNLYVNGRTICIEVFFCFLKFFSVRRTRSRHRMGTILGAWGGSLNKHFGRCNPAKIAKHVYVCIACQSVKTLLFNFI